MVNGDLSHSAWLTPQPDELSLLEELYSPALPTMPAFTSLPQPPRWGAGVGAEVPPDLEFSGDGEDYDL